ncbi:MAG: helix-turn-helix domain-containing protein [Vicinamibacterales bacterium]
MDLNIPIRGSTPAEQCGTQARVPRRKSPGRTKKPTEPLPELQPLANRLERLRLERGLSQFRVAEGAGISAKYLGRVESAYVNPSALVLLGLADALGVSVGELFEPSTPADGSRYFSLSDGEALSSALKALTGVVERLVKGEPRPLPKRAPRRPRR